MGGTSAYNVRPGYGGRGRGSPALGLGHMRYLLLLVALGGTLVLIGEQLLTSTWDEQIRLAMSSASGTLAPAPDASMGSGSGESTWTATGSGEGATLAVATSPEGVSTSAPVAEVDPEPAGDVTRTDETAEQGIAGAASGEATAADSDDGGEGEDKCHMEAHAEYDADQVVTWGDSHLTDTPEECCDACTKARGCNVWVHCTSPSGCNGRNHGECWLKRHKYLNIDKPDGARNPSVGWTSGMVYEKSYVAKFRQHQAEVAAAEAARLQALKDDPNRPLVWLDVEIKGVPQGRMMFALFSEESPRAAENFRALCTGEAGIAPKGHEGAGKPYHFKGKFFYRIIDRFIDQTGAETESVFGGMFKDDEGGLQLKHDRPFLLSMANMGPNTNTSHFSITMAPAHHLDGHYTIFGEMVEGHEVARAINALATANGKNEAGREGGAKIVDSGMIRGERASHLYE